MINVAGNHPDATSALVYGIFSKPVPLASATTGFRAIGALARTAAAAYTCAELTGLDVAASTLGAGSTATAVYGIKVAAQTVGASNYGAAIGAASTQTLWVSSDADNTSAAAGIAFGLSRDTTLSRSAAGVLFTNSTFNAAALISRSGVDAQNGTIQNSTGAVSILAAAANPQILFYGSGQECARFDTSGNFAMADNRHIATGTTTGTKIGVTSSQKLGFYGTTPVVRPASTPAAATDPATTMALVNDLRTKLLTLGLIG